ncbi:MAG: hypothetical protein M1497_15455 [Nitrospirae bacterium]|nr:hypothetical protein [Nitrospirota bacterium]
MSLSMFVNNCIEALADLLEKIEKERKASKEYTVPMSFIIKSLVESEDILGVYRDWPEELPDKLEFMLQDWQDEYEAKQSRIPAEFIPYMKSGLYILSPNKKYLIEKNTGERYIIGGKRTLIPLVRKKQPITKRGKA